MTKIANSGLALQVAAEGGRVEARLLEEHPAEGARAGKPYSPGDLVHFQGSMAKQFLSALYPDFADELVRRFVKRCFEETEEMEFRQTRYSGQRFQRQVAVEERDRKSVV